MLVNRKHNSNLQQREIENSRHSKLSITWDDLIDFEPLNVNDKISKELENAIESEKHKVDHINFQRPSEFKIEGFTNPKNPIIILLVILVIMAMVIATVTIIKKLKDQIQKITTNSRNWRNLVINSQRI